VPGSDRYLFAPIAVLGRIALVVIEKISRHLIRHLAPGFGPVAD
jgi:hypothetical protein